MNNRRWNLTILLILLLSVLFLAALLWLNYQYAVQNSGMDGFLPYWSGTREFLYNGRSPYSPEVIQASEKLAYGRAAYPGERRGYFLYPFFSFYIFTPFALIENYHVAKTVWMVVLELSIIVNIWMILDLSRWRPARWIVILLAVFATSWYHHVRPVLNSDPLVLCSFFVILSFWAIGNNHDTLAGFLIALTLMQPEPVILLILFTMVWSISNRRLNILYSFAISLGFLLLTTILLMPGWVLDNIRLVFEIYTTTFSNTPGNMLASWLPGIGKQAGWAITIVLVGALLVEWRAALGRGFRWYFWTACFTLVATTMIGLRTSLDNYIYLAPAIIIVMAVWDQRWGKLGHILITISFILLTLGIWAISVVGAQDGVRPDANLNLFFFVPGFLLITIYWVRFWYIRPTKLLLEGFSERIG